MTFVLMFLEFFKTGLFAIGGGLATLPFLYDMAEKYTWFNEAILSDMIAISESTPGPIGINMATYVGYNVGSQIFGIPGGIMGALLTTTALVLPSLIVILIIAKFLERFKTNVVVKDAFYGLRPAVTALIAYAGYQVAADSLFRFGTFFQTLQIGDLFVWKAIILFTVLMILSRVFKKVHPAAWIGIAAVAGVLLKF